jgi:hypothetical protein
VRGESSPNQHLAASFLEIALASHMHQKPAMLHKCANPTCPNPFRKLSEGKLFLVETDGLSSSKSGLRRWDEGTQRRVEHFWLCAQCAAVLTLTFERGKGLKTVPLHDSVRKKPAASVVLAVAAADGA